jgi:hypothetical protein
LGLLGTQETPCILIAGLLERDIFDLYLPEFDKPWVIHLRETCCCSTNLYTWRPNTVYKNRSVRRHHLVISSLQLSSKYLNSLNWGKGRLLTIFKFYICIWSWKPPVVTDFPLASFSHLANSSHSVSPAYQDEQDNALNCCIEVYKAKSSCHTTSGYSWT